MNTTLAKLATLSAVMMVVGVIVWEGVLWVM